MKTVLTKGLTTEQKEEIKRDFLASTLLRERLQAIIKEKGELAHKASITKDNYLSPNWAYLQADSVGYQRALEEVFSLLE